MPEPPLQPKPTHLRSAGIIELRLKFVSQATASPPPACLSVQRLWTVLRLKQALAEWAGEPAEQQLVFEGKILADNSATLGAVGVHGRGATLFVAVRRAMTPGSMPLCGGARIRGWAPPPRSALRSALHASAWRTAQCIGCLLLTLCAWHNGPAIARGIRREQIGGVILMWGICAFVSRQLQRARARKAAAASAAAGGGGSCDLVTQIRRAKDVPKYPDDVAMPMGAGGG